MGANHLFMQISIWGTVVGSVLMYLTTVASDFCISKDLSYDRSETGTIVLFRTCCLAFHMSLSLWIDAGYSPDNYTSRTKISEDQALD